MTGRWRILALLSGAELLGMSLWFTASAVSPQLAELWGLSASQAGWLTTVVQLGFVAGTAVAAVLNLADILPERRYFAGSAALGGLANVTAGSIWLAGRGLESLGLGAGIQPLSARAGFRNRFDAPAEKQTFGSHFRSCCDPPVTTSVICKSNGTRPPDP